LKKRIKVDCPVCQVSFCSSCSQFPYHYSCDCEEVLPLTKGWLEWLQGKQEEYLKQLKESKMKGFETLYDDYLIEKEKKEQADKKEKSLEIGQKLEEMISNEKGMQNTCKICPKCGIPAVKVSLLFTIRLCPPSLLFSCLVLLLLQVSGCNHVICGNAWSGAGTVKKSQGCGTHFQWNTAEKYVSKLLKKEGSVDLAAIVKVMNLVYSPLDPSFFYLYAIS
jgi:hypothetical protein